MRNIAESALRVINSEGAFLGQPVTLIVADETESVEAASATITDMIANKVDVIIGPSSSRVAGAVAMDIIDAGIGLCSPAAPSILLDELPDKGLMIRTSRTDRSLARAIGDFVAKTGYASATVLYPDDPYGRRFADEVTSRLKARGLNATPTEPSSGTDSSAAEATLNVTYRVDADGAVTAEPALNSIVSAIIVLIGDERSTTAVLPLLAQKRVYVSDTLVNVDPNEFSSTSLDENGNLVQGVLGDAYAGSAELIASLRELDPETNLGSVERIPLLAAVVDCINVVTLAANAVKSDDAGLFMNATLDVTNVGTGCVTFAECRAALDQGLGIDYDGPTGELGLDSNGDAISGTVLTYVVSGTGTARLTGQIRVETND